MNSYKVSVIMPIFNAEKFLERTINSIIHQSIGFENIELLLVNDNSTDSTKDIIEHYSRKYNNIKSFHSTVNHGYPGYGRNIGLYNATADYIMFIDNDDEYDEKYCEVMLNAIQEQDCDVVCGNYTIKVPNRNLDISCFSKVENYIEINENYRLINLNNISKIFDSEVWTKIFKRSIITENNIKFIEHGLNEDSLFLYEYYYYAKKLIYVDYYGYVWYRDNESLSKISSKSTLDFINSYYIILKFLNTHYENFNYRNFYKGTIEATIIRIIYSDNKKFLLKKLYAYEKSINFNDGLNHKWSTIINKLILNQKYSLVIIILSCLKYLKILIDQLRKINKFSN